MRQRAPVKSALVPPPFRALDRGSASAHLGSRGSLPFLPGEQERSPPVIGRLPRCRDNGPGRRDQYIRPGPGAARRALVASAVAVVVGDSTSPPPPPLLCPNTSLVSARFAASVRTGAATSTGRMLSSRRTLLLKTSPAARLTRARARRGVPSKVLRCPRLARRLVTVTLLPRLTFFRGSPVVSNQKAGRSSCQS